MNTRSIPTDNQFDKIPQNVNVNVFIYNIFLRDKHTRCKTLRALYNRRGQHVVYKLWVIIEFNIFGKNVNVSKLFILLKMHQLVTLC